MTNVALLPSMALLAGTYAGIAWAGPFPGLGAILVGLWLAALASWAVHRGTLAVVLATSAYVLAGVALGSAAAHDALRPPLREVLNQHAGGFSLAAIGPGGAHEPLVVRARLIEDAAAVDSGVLLRVDIEAVTLANIPRPASGGIRLVVAGTAVATRAREWRAGRTIIAPVTFRRPARYLNDGVRDFEKDLALDSVALVGSVKSGLLVEVLARGSVVSERAADVRAYVRHVVTRRVAPHDPVAAAIVIAILIGDRSALPDAIRERLQAAGTYHVIAISGGNIAILTAVILGSLSVAGVRGRIAACLVIAVLLGCSVIVNAGPSVWRATVMAVVYFAARVIDHRSPPWNAMAVSAALLTCLAPLDVRNVGFALTFGATAAILEAARRVRITYSAPVAWISASLAASLAVEVVLLPVNATFFSRATMAGVVLNLIAVPLMAVVQVAGLVLVALGRVDWIGEAAGYLAATAARGLVDSARLVEIVPWLATRVPPPSAALTLCYYVAFASALIAHRWRSLALVALAICAGAIVTGRPIQGVAPDRHLRLTAFDVGQGDAVLLQFPNRAAVLVDAGGVGFESSTFDIGGRVLAPALWARGVRRLDAFGLTHGDPDHIGGGAAIVRDFSPSEIWEGVPVPAHVPLKALLDAGIAAGSSVRRLTAGAAATFGEAQVRILSPRMPDWDRVRVRNDDSLVVEVTFGDVAILLTGDAGAEIERQIVSQLTPARVRILKVGHHGSRTSTSQALLDGWKPHVAIVSCGRGNRFGHPAPEVVRRLDEAGARVFRTDRDGQITIETDGKTVGVRTYVGR